MVAETIKNIGSKFLKSIISRPLKYILLFSASLFLSLYVNIKFLELTGLRYEDTGAFGILLILSLPFVLSSIIMYLMAIWLEDDYLKNNFGKLNVFGLVAVVMLLIVFDLIVNMNMGRNIFGVFQHTKTFADLNTSDGWAQRGQWGDVLSGHFSALAFIALALSIYIQGKTLKIQQEELDRQKEELKLQRNHDTFKTIMEMINSVELMIEKKGIKVGSVKLSSITEARSYLIKQKHHIAELMIACGNDITELESSSKAVRILARDLTTEQKEIVNIKIQKFVVANRTLAATFILNQIFRYFGNGENDKENAFRNMFFLNRSDMGKELAAKAEELAKKVESGGGDSPIDSVLAEFDDKDDTLKEIMAIADKYLGVK